MDTWNPDWLPVLERLLADLQEVSHDPSHCSDALVTGVSNRGLFDSSSGSSPQKVAAELASWGMPPEAVSDILEDMED